MTTERLTVSAPARGRKWPVGAIIRCRDTGSLYCVTGEPVRYHEDRLPVQAVSAVRDMPADWIAAQRLLAIADHVCASGAHTPAPALDGDYGMWEAEGVIIEIGGDVIRVARSTYERRQTVAWVRDATLAGETRELIAQGPDTRRYPAVRISA